jgi:spermidine synthase
MAAVILPAGLLSAVAPVVAKLQLRDLRQTGTIVGKLSGIGGDARTGLQQQPRGRFDLVVGDAFGGLAVPWHLTTREVAEQVRDVLTGDGVYAVNVIDYQPDRFARAEAATLRSVFGHVVLLGAPVTVAGEGGGNHILVASRRPLPLPAIQRRLAERNPWVVADEPATAPFAGRAQVLTDAHAPVDQLITQFSG